MPFNIHRIAQLSVPVTTGWLLSSCMEAKGKQDLWTQRKPEVLKALRERAIIQSVESSNRIEGVIVDAGRLKPLIDGVQKPKDRPEEEIVGYRRALSWIFKRKKKEELTSEIIQHLHKLCQGGMISDAGGWKTKNNEIIEIDSKGDRKVRFVPLEARLTPKAMKELCKEYADIADRNELPVLLAIATCVFDFLCIHPFRDGNGRVSRLLTTFLLSQAGFEVCRYISLERLVEENKEDYYEVLKKCSSGWHKNKNELLPWINFFLSILRDAYKDFAEQVEVVQRVGGKSDIIRKLVQDQVASFTLSDIHSQILNASPQLIKRVLYQLKKEKKIALSGKGKSARWKKLHSV